MLDMRLGRPARGGLGILLLALAAGGAWYALHGQYRFATIRDGVYYRSGTMPPERLQSVVQQHGIRTVIDFRFASDDTERERAAMAAVGVAYHNLPTVQVPSDETVAAFLAILEDPANQPVLAHCHHGVGRAPLFAAIYRIEHEGFTPEQARQAAKLITFTGDFAPDGDKGGYLASYRPRRAALRAP